MPKNAGGKDHRDPKLAEQLWLQSGSLRDFGVWHFDLDVWEKDDQVTRHWKRSR